MAGKLKPILGITLVGMLSLAVVRWGGDWLLSGRFEMRTDDAYVAGDIVTIAPRISGHVTEMMISDNVPVKAGDVLFRIDDRSYLAAVAEAQAAVSQAEAAIAVIDAQRAVQLAAVDQAEANLTEAVARLDLARRTYERQDRLSKSRATAIANFDAARADLVQSEARIRATEAARTSAQRQIKLIESQRQSADASLAAARARLDAARINLDSTAVRAPMDGVIGNRKVQIGRFVSAGGASLDLVRVDNVWIWANLRETELEKVTQGQPARITVDGFPDMPVTGVVDSIAPGSGAVFSLIPPDNATGNFVRIVQRVPVKIRVTDVPKEVRLIPGMSAKVAIQVSGETAASPPRATDNSRDSKDGVPVAEGGQEKRR